MSNDRPFTPSEAQHYEVKTDDPALQRAGIQLFQQLTKQVGIGKATGILYIAFVEAVMLVLHTESPLPEANIAAMESLADSVKDNIEQHKECALNCGQEKRFAQALENGSIEPPDAPEKPTCH